MKASGTRRDRIKKLQFVLPDLPDVPRGWRSQVLSTGSVFCKRQKDREEKQHSREMTQGFGGDHVCYPL